MSKIIKTLSILFIVNFTNAQVISLNNDKIQEYIDNLSIPKKELIVNSFQEESNNDINDISNNYSHNYQVPRRMILKSLVRRGSLKVGSSFFSAQQLIGGTDIAIFNSQVLETTIPFIKKTGVPYLNAEIEYTILDRIGIGGFVGYTRSENSNRDSNGVRAQSIAQGYVLGVQGSWYNQVSNFLYLPLYMELNFENGKIDYTNGLNVEKYIFQRYRLGVGAGISIAINDRAQLEFRGLDISYNNVDFAQTIKTDSVEGTFTRSDQKIERNTIAFGANPRVRFLAEIITLGRDK